MAGFGFCRRPKTGWNSGSAAIHSMAKNYAPGLREAPVTSCKTPLIVDAKRHYRSLVLSVFWAPAHFPKAAGSMERGCHLTYK
jgi:hypothetical protein